jgi:hypothetical protein
MKRSENLKVVVLNSDFTVDNGNFTTTPVDIGAWESITILSTFGNVPANVVTLKVQECDTSGGVYADVTGLIVGTSTDTDGTTSSLPTAAAGDGTVIIFEIDGKNRKRYIDLVCTAGDGSGSATEFSGLALLSRGKALPKTATARGAAHVLRV